MQHHRHPPYLAAYAQLCAVARVLCGGDGVADDGGFFRGRISSSWTPATCLSSLRSRIVPRGTPEARGGAGWNHLALQIDDVDAAFRHLSALGVPFQAEPADYPEGEGIMRIAFLTDPDGNTIELLQSLQPLPPMTGKLPHD